MAMRSQTCGYLPSRRTLPAGRYGERPRNKFGFQSGLEVIDAISADAPAAAVMKPVMIY